MLICGPAGPAHSCDFILASIRGVIVYPSESVQVEIFRLLVQRWSAAVEKHVYYPR